jgi:peptidoglycan/LPS O-acetylase OafA/YrhL
VQWSRSLPKAVLPGLTGIRGVAAFAVFLCHFQPIVLSVFGLDDNAEVHLIANGFRGVDLFFVLSGFILFHVHESDFQTITLPALCRFYLLRFFRVYPLNTFVLVVLLPLPFFLPDFVSWYKISHLNQGEYHLRDFSFGAFVQSLFLAQAWTVAKLGTWNEPAWTLSAEVVGYAAFPLLAHLIVREISALRLLLLALGSLACLVLLMVVGGHATNNPSGIFGTIRMAGCFFAGLCLARLFHLQVLSAAMSTFITAVATISTFFFLWYDNLGTLTVFSFAALIFGLAYARGPISDFITSRPVTFLGKISFSFYMTHVIPLNLFIWALDGRVQKFNIVLKFGAVAGLAIACVLIAIFTYRVVELRFQKFGQKCSSNLLHAHLYAKRAATIS